MLTQAEKDRLILEAEKRFGRPLTDAEKARLFEEYERTLGSRHEHVGPQKREANEFLRRALFLLGLAAAASLLYLFFFRGFRAPHEEIKHEPVVIEHKEAQVHPEAPEKVVAEKAPAVVADAAKRSLVEKISKKDVEVK